MAIITFKDLERIRKLHQDQVVVFCSGVFDLTHVGHVLFFEDCKKHGDILVVAVGEDASVRELKGENRPILNQHLRLKMVDSMRQVDYCLMGLTPKGQPLQFIETIFKKLRPDKYVVNDDAFAIPLRKKMVEKHRVKFVVLKRYCPKEFDGISTSKIIDKVRDLV